jgi:nucleotide-binding universal stress UspA family protein
LIALGKRYSDSFTQEHINMKKVILATDGSVYANEAAWFLAHLPRHEKMELTVLTVLDDPAIARNYPSAVWLEEALTREKEMAQEAFKRIQEMFEGANATLKSVIRHGHRGETIVQVAHEENADLVVVGARGHSAVSRLLLGSTSDFVATHVPCSVLVVRPTSVRHTDHPLRIAIGYQRSEPAHAAIEQFREIKWGREAEVNLVFVVPLLAGFLNDVVVDIEASKEAAQLLVDNASGEIRDVAPNVKGEVVASDHIGEGLVTFVEQNHCDLVVIGETPRTALGRFLLGSTTLFVLRHSPSSIWITRKPAREEVPEAREASQLAVS